MLRGKIILELRSDKLPEVKFFGDVCARDIQFSKLAIQKTFRIYVREMGKKEIAKQEEAEQEEKEEQAKKDVEVRKVVVNDQIEKLQQEQSEIASKEKDTYNESGLSESTKERPGSTQTGSEGSRPASRQGRGSPIRSDRSRGTGHSTGRSQETKRETASDVEVDAGADQGRDESS